MGIYDREYLRDDSGRGGWFSGNGAATRALIAIQVALFFVGSIGYGAGLINRFAAIPNVIFDQWQVYRLLTGQFLPVPNDILAIVFGMLILWWVGRELESIYGTSEFLAFYLGAVVLSTLGWALFDKFGPGSGFGILLGSNAAILALLVLITIHFPTREILFMFVLPVRLWVLLAIAIGFDFFQLLGVLGRGDGGSQTVYFAHLAGAGYAWAYHALDFRWMRYLDVDRLRRPRLRVVRPEVREVLRPNVTSGPRPSSANYVPDEQFDAQLDDILGKIASEGRESLTEDERVILQEASRRARDRRGERL